MKKHSQFLFHIPMFIKNCLVYNYYVCLLQNSWQIIYYLLLFEIKILKVTPANTLLFLDITILAIYKFIMELRKGLPWEGYNIMGIAISRRTLQGISLFSVYF